MKDLEYRKLYDGDNDQLVSLIDEHDKIQRSILVSIDENKYDSQFYWGAFKNKELITAIRAYPLNKISFYCIGSLYIKPGYMNHFSWDPEKNPTINVFKRITEHFESQGKYSFYYTRSIQRWPEKMRRQNRDFFSIADPEKKYIRLIDEIVRANTESAYPFHNFLLGNRTWPIDVMIVQCALKNKYRNHTYKLEEDDE